MSGQGVKKKLCIAFAAGGTGGHVFPAVAVAEALRRKVKDVRCVFIGTKGKIENTIVPRYGFELFTVWLSGMQRGSIIKNATLPLKIIVSMVQARNIFSRVRPQAVVCAGGYVSYPAGLAALRAKLPLVLMESNSYPGLVIRKLSAKATSIHVAFESSRQYFDTKAAMYVSGNPVRAGFADQIARSEARKMFGLDPDKKTLLVFGGSLGARTINEAVMNALEDFSNKGIQVIWQTGKAWNSPVKKENIAQLPFIEQMHAAYVAADLVVCRAGATTLAELTYLGVPSVLVPYPHAADNHQEKNAFALTDAGAAVMIRDDELSEKFLPIVMNLMADDLHVAAMKDAAWSLGVRDAADRIAENVLAVAGYNG
jgi:UDP-N-acetylglucosamine--N-acetylmuramyl-(pentapeptide) pyrophosphoryl-undecaprenol N-acetylglucosamine transferase